MEAFITFYKNQSIEKKSAFWLAICNVVNKGISLIVVPIYTRILSQEEYGTYSVFLTWLDLFTIIATLEISRGHYPVGITKYDNDINRYTSSMLGLSSLITMLFIGVFLIFQKPLVSFIGLPGNIVFMTLLFLLVFPAWEFWRIQERFKYHYKKMVFVTLLISAVTPIVGILGITAFKKGLYSAIYSRLVIQGVVAFALYFMFIKQNNKVFNKEYWKEAFTFNIVLIPYFLSTTVLNQADRIMINDMVGSAEAAIYSVAYSISMLMLLVNNALSDSFLPWIYRKLKEKSYKSIEPTTNKLLLIVAGFNLLLILFAPEAIAFFAPIKYQQAIWIIPPLTSSTFFMFLFQRYINVEMYYGATKSNSSVSICVAFLNILLNYFCIRKWGYFAAAYTTLISYIVFAFLHYLVVRRVCKNNCSNIQIFKFGFSAIIGAFFVLISFALMLLYPYAFIRYFLISVCLIVSARLGRPKTALLD